MQKRGSSLINILLLPVALILLLAACSMQTKQAQQLEEEVLHIHDEVMPKISTVLKLRKKIHTILDSTQTTAEKDTLNKISYELTKADIFMSDWMHHYQKPNLEHDTAIRYLTEQRMKIEAVSAQINKSIEQAGRIIK